MRTIVRLLVVVGALVAAQTLGTGAGAAAPCVRVGSTCYTSVPDALAAARDGDTVYLPAGTFPGGVRVTTSITLQGAGADKTVLAGGGPVLTIGSPGADAQPRVTVRGVTLTGGRVTSTLVPGIRAVAAGGGLQILPASAGRGGTVTVVDSAITGNSAEPAEQFTDPSRPDWPKCPTGPCPFAGALGAGIDNWGDLTLHGSLVAGNTAAGALTSNAAGGGIATEAGSLTLESSTVSGNRALAGGAWGRFAEGGGILNTQDTSLTIDHSSVVENESRLDTGFPSVLPDGTPLELLANGGGVHVSGQTTPVTVTASHIDRNITSVVGPNAQDGALNAGMQAGGGPLEMHDSTVSQNVLTADLQAAPTALGGVLQWDGVADVSGSEVAGNVTTITARQGGAAAGGAVAALAIAVQGHDPGPSLVQHSVVRDNVLTLVAPNGRAIAFGGGLTNDANTVLDDVRVRGNRVVASSLTATLEGGGIWNGRLPDPAADPASPPPPPSQLTVRGSRVERNVLTGPRGAQLQGGGVYTGVPVLLPQTRVLDNLPDRCSGPGC